MPERLRPSTTDGFSTGGHHQHNHGALSRKPKPHRHVAEHYAANRIGLPSLLQHPLQLP
jgi:hypothetical protein